MTSSECAGSEPASRLDILGAMQEAAAPGQLQLDFATLQTLRDYTRELKELAGAEAEAEFERFVGVTERGLHLQEVKLRDQLQDKTILVTGGTGCIGSALLRELVKYSPAELVSVSRGVTLPNHTTAGVDYRHADLRSSDATKDVVREAKPDIIYHLAAQHDPSLAEVEVNRTLATNIFGTRNVIDAARVADVPQIVYASTGKAMRPFTPDTYASSKKVGEWLMANTAANDEITCSGVRFTHVVDNSIIFKRLQNWIDEDLPIRLHGPDILFYMQSARESAHLLLNAGLEAQPDSLWMEAIRDLQWPVDLADLALGSLIKRGADTPIYIAGYEKGYEEVSYPGLYDPKYSYELSPLINALEAPKAQHSSTCSEVDSFPFEVAPSSDFRERLVELEAACYQGKPNEVLKKIKDELSWEMLDSRLAAVERPILEQSVRRMAQYPYYDQLPAEHVRTAEAIQHALESCKP